MCHLSYIDKGAGTFPSRKRCTKGRGNAEKPSRERRSLILYPIKVYALRISRTSDVPNQATTRDTTTGRRMHAGTHAHALEMNCTRTRVHNAHTLGRVAYLGNAVKMAFFLKKAHKKSAEYTFYLSKKYQKLGANERFN